MSNRFYTLMIVPEKTSTIRKLIVPAWLVRGAIVGMVFCALFAAVFFFDYWFIMQQIDENRDLKLENRRLRQQVQVFRNRMESIEKRMDRIQTFTTRLKVITNIEDKDSFAQRILSEPVSEAAANTGAKTPNDKPETNASTLTASSATKTGSATATTLTPSEITTLAADQAQMDVDLSTLSQDSMELETNLQDLYELLADQQSFLSALPTRKPAIGYFTSGFGVRKSPYSDRWKMHEGLDIANHPGTPIRAPSDGEVSFAGQKPGYGRTLVLNHGYGMETWYAHTSRIIVKIGQHIKRGELVAMIGNTGHSTGPHLHYEVRVNGIPVDPLHYVLEN